MKNHPPSHRASFIDKALIVAAAIFALAGCQSTDAPVGAEALQPHDALMGTLWVQTSGEYRALCELAYGASGAFLETALADTDWSAAREQVNRDVSGLPQGTLLISAN
ncbi:MAG: hypothetical protein GVY36_12780 [Verrucomicrobia bacterium]|jgi:uncharacterized lipoprotein YajG|nr:hypothetical protein [Verrucomicrobiota bacterium]